jgi:hypothetical protein
MIRELFSETGGFGVYGIVSTLIFFLFFLSAVAWAFLARADYVEHMSRLPLDQDQHPVDGD